MLHYFYEWLHIYSIHFGALVALGLVTTVYVRGLPEPKEICGLLKSAVALGAIIAVFSSHAHAHYLSHFVK